MMGETLLRGANVEGADFQDVALSSVIMDFANFSQAKNAVIPGHKKNIR